MKKLCRTETRKIAVECIFAHEASLQEERTRAAVKPKKEAKPKPQPKKETVVIEKKLAHGRRRIEMKTDEYEKRVDQLKEWFPEEKKTISFEQVESNEPKTLDIEELIGNTCETSGVIGDDPFDIDELKLQKEYEDYLYPVVQGVIDNISEIDGLISKNSEKWIIDRINKTDLAILRVAIYELLKLNIPTEVVINEAVNIAKSYNEESQKFVNGVLAGVLKDIQDE